MAFTPPPPVPQRGARATFSAAVDTFLRWMAALPAQLDAFLARLETIAAGGAYAIPYVFDSTSTAATDPGTGRLRLNQYSAQNTSTTIVLDTMGSDGTDYTAEIDTFNLSTSAVKGQLKLIKQGDASKFLVFRVSGRQWGGGFHLLDAICIRSSGVNPFNNGDGLILQFTPNGDKGEVGNADKKVQTAPAPVNGVVTVDYRNGNCLVWDPPAGTSTLTITNWPAAGTLGEFWIEGTNLGAAGKTLNISVAVNWLRPDGTYANNTSITTNHGVILRPSGDDTVLLWGRAGAPAKGKVAR